MESDVERAALLRDDARVFSTSRVRTILALIVFTLIALLGVILLPTESKEPPVVSFLRTFVKDSNNQPNPRVSCTEGNFEARYKLAKLLQELQLNPLGNVGPGNFIFKVAGFDDSEFCPHGIANVIGYLEGSDPVLKNEFILLDAHYDGPNNQLGAGKLFGREVGNVQRQFGNEDTDDAYDDGSGVAVLATLAQELIVDRPRRSIIFSFSDAEEGGSNLGVPRLGETDTIKPDSFFEACTSLGRNCREDFQFPIGMAGWASQSGFDFSRIKLIISADPLGAPGFHGTEMIGIQGTESTPGLLDFVKDNWPSDGPRPLFSNRKYASTSYNDADVLTSSCKPTCAVVDGGIPFLWLAQTGFQRYHGGMNIGLLNELYQVALTHLSTPVNLAEGSQAFFAQDRFCNMDLSALVNVQVALKEFVIKISNSPGLSSLKYNGAYDYDGWGKFTYQDAINNVEILNFAQEAIAKGRDITGFPPLLSQKLQQIILEMKAVYQPFTTNVADRAAVVPDASFQTLAPLVTAFVIGIDFFKALDKESLTQFAPTYDSTALPKPCSKRR